MNTDKAYIMGLVMGGGGFSLDHKTFHIRLPYKQWGEYEKNPERAGIIANDILKVVKPLMMVEYGLDVSYSAGKDWKIICHGDTTKLISDLKSFSIEPTSELQKSADLSKLIESLSDMNMKKRFIAGVADTIGSMNPNHRRFSDDVQIISFEIRGFNYKYVCQLCNLLYQLGCVPDQILWQHPNMQCGTDAYYTSWKKGNKLRVTLDSFSTFGSMAFKSKSIASKENKKKESAGRYNAAERCENKKLSVPGIVAVHVDENHREIPEDVRGCHFIHHKQICGALNCPHAPKAELSRILKNAEFHISPFTVLHKDNAIAIKELIAKDALLSNRKYTKVELRVIDLATAFKNGSTMVEFINDKAVYKNSKERGYPLNVIMDALSFIISSKTGNLKGKRPKGNRDEIIENALKKDQDFLVTFEVPDLMTPIILTDSKYSAMVGPMNATVYKNLISFSEDNKNKMKIRNVTEEDLR